MDGVIPEDNTQDSGNATPPDTDPFSMVLRALSFGRQKNGLPDSFFGAKPKSSNNPQETAQAVADEGGAGEPDGDGRAMSMNGAARNLQPGEQVGEGANAVGYKPQTQWLAEGGSVGDDEDKGVVPDGEEQPEQRGDPMGEGGYPDVFQGQSQGQGGQQGQQQDPQKILGYLSGADAMQPEMAMALERQADPTGRMDPNTRKMLAVRMAGSPDKAWGLLQHFRQRFNAYNSFAKVSAEGSPHKPADLMASARAAQQAYENLPDGNSMQFTPTQGGMQVAVRKIIPSKPAPSGGEQPPPTQMFEEGGSVKDDDEDQTGAIPEQVEDNGGGEPSDSPSFPGGTAPHQALRNFVLSIPQYVSWLTKHGQADAVLEKGAEATLQDAAKEQPAQQGAPAGTEQPAQDGGQQQPAQPQGNRAFQHPAPPTGARPFPQPPVKSQVDPELMRSINAQYPYVGQERERQAAIAHAIGEHQGRENKVEVAKQTGASRVEVANVGAGSRLEANKNTVKGRLDVSNNQETHRDTRAAAGNETKRTIADTREGGTESRFQRSEQGKNYRTEVANKPSMIGNKDAIAKASGARGAGAQQPQPQGQGQMKLVNGKWYKRGPNGEAVPVQ